MINNMTIIMLGYFICLTTGHFSPSYFCRNFSYSCSTHLWKEESITKEHISDHKLKMQK